jgi:hypothetical protein
MKKDLFENKTCSKNRFELEDILASTLSVVCQSNPLDFLK